MDIILLSSIVDGQASTECTFEVVIDGGQPVPADVSLPGLAQVVMPDGATQIEIRANPITPYHWAVTGVFKRQASGQLVALNAPAEFAPPRGVSDGTQGLILVSVHLSRLKDVTSTALSSLGQVLLIRTGTVPQRPQVWPPTAWDTPLLNNLNYISNPPITNSNISVTSLSKNPDTVDLVLQLKGVAAPETIAISWPNAIARNDNAGPTPFLVYFHAGVNQNAGSYYTHPQVGTYPFGFDYVYFGLWRYINYLGNPLTVDPYLKGLPYQMSAAGKNAVIVLPCSKVGPEVGVLLDAASMEQTLREIQAFMFRWAGVYVPPDLGRTALASFSSGNGLVTRFLAKPSNQSHRFYLETLRELYMFDAPGYMGPTWVDQSMRWASRGSDKMVRAYTTYLVANYSKLLGQSTPASSPFVVSSTDPNQLRTAGVLPASAWNRAATAAGNANMARTWQDAHQLVSAMMLTDALNRSGF